MGEPARHGDIPRGGLLPVTGAPLAAFVTAAIAMVVLGTIFLLHTRGEDK